MERELKGQNRKPRIKKEIIEKDKRPSLTMNEDDIYKMVEGLDKDAADEDTAKDLILDYIEELCCRYDRDVMKNELDDTYWALDELDQALGEREKFYAASVILERHEDGLCLCKDYDLWKKDDDKKNPHAFYMYITSEKSGDAGKKKHYYFDKGRFLEILYSYEKVRLRLYDCGHMVDYPFLREYSIGTLKKFALYLSFAFLNLNMEEVLEKYITAVKTRKKSRHSEAEREGFSIFQNVPPITETRPVVGSDERAFEAIWGDFS